MAITFVSNDYCRFDVASFLVTLTGFGWSMMRRWLLQMWQSDALFNLKDLWQLESIFCFILQWWVFVDFIGSMWIQRRQVRYCDALQLISCDVRLWIWVFFDMVGKYLMVWEFKWVLDMTDVSADSVYDFTFICVFSSVQWTMMQGSQWQVMFLSALTQWWMADGAAVRVLAADEIVIGDISVTSSGWSDNSPLVIGLWWHSRNYELGWLGYSRVLCVIFLDSLMLLDCIILFRFISSTDLSLLIVSVCWVLLLSYYSAICLRRRR